MPADPKGSSASQRPEDLEDIDRQDEGIPGELPQDDDLGPPGRTAD